MPDEKQDWESFALQEYAILQDKIDRIGDFRFRVKGWVVTLITAVLVTGLASDMPAYALLLGLPVIASFQLLEHHQAIWQSAFGRRLFMLEVSLRRSQSVGEGAPAIAHAVVEASKHAAKSSILRRVFLQSFLVFYTLMYFLVAVSFAIKLLNDEPSAPARIEIINPIDVRVDSPSGIQ